MQEIKSWTENYCCQQKNQAYKDKTMGFPIKVTGCIHRNEN